MSLVMAGTSRHRVPGTRYGRSTGREQERLEISTASAWASSSRLTRRNVVGSPVRSCGLARYFSALPPRGRADGRCGHHLRLLLPTPGRSHWRGGGTGPRLILPGLTHPARSSLQRVMAVVSDALAEASICRKSPIQVVTGRDTQIWVIWQGQAA